MTNIFKCLFYNRRVTFLIEAICNSLVMSHPIILPILNFTNLVNNIKGIITKASAAFVELLALNADLNHLDFHLERIFHAHKDG